MSECSGDLRESRNYQIRIWEHRLRHKWWENNSVAIIKINNKNNNSVAMILVKIFLKFNQHLRGFGGYISN